jgi:hypothetical protein
MRISTWDRARGTVLLQNQDVLPTIQCFQSSETGPILNRFLEFHENHAVDYQLALTLP